MKKNIVILLHWQVVAKLLLLECLCLAVAGTSTQIASASVEQPQSVAVTVTNWIPRFITNMIEVRMPQNQFVDEFRTNLVERFVTNVVDVYWTNVITQLRTNEVEIRRVETEEILAYQTNVIYAYQTNLKTLILTNWETVLVMKTNWFRQPVTNTVEIELPSPAPAAVASATPVSKEGKVDTTGETVHAADVPRDLVIELTCTAGSAAVNELNVLMTLRSTHNPAAILPVQEWRVERSDNTVLIFGQTLEFRSKLPTGAYKISAKTRSDAKSPFLTVRGDVTITSAGGNQRIPARVSTSGK